MGEDGRVTASYRPEAEVVELCRDLIRIDTSNFGPDPGPGERAAAEHVAELLDEVGIASRAGRVRARADVAGGALGARGRRPPLRPLLIHGHLDVVPANADDWSVPPVRRRGGRRLRLGPRRGRHEGLRRDAAERRPRPGPGRARRRGGRSG